MPLFSIFEISLNELCVENWTINFPHSHSVELYMFMYFGSFEVLAFKLLIFI